MFLSSSHLHQTIHASAIRIQLTINNRYADFPHRSVMGTVFGVEMPVASLPDVVQGKLCAATDPHRRTTKRQKDAVDLARLAESHPHVFSLIPPGTIPTVDEIRPPQNP